MISVFAKTTPGHIVAGIFVLAATTFFILIAAADILMLIKVNRY
jgi:hypothetical protein